MNSITAELVRVVDAIKNLYPYIKMVIAIPRRDEPILIDIEQHIILELNNKIVMHKHGDGCAFYKEYNMADLELFLADLGTLL